MENQTIHYPHLNIGSTVELDFAGPKVFTVYDMINDIAYLSAPNIRVFMRKRGPSEWAMDKCLVNK